MLKKIKKILIIVELLFICTLHVFSQQGDSELLESESHKPTIKEVSLSRFENIGDWYSIMKDEDGTVTDEIIPVNTSDLEQTEGEHLVDGNAFEARVDFNRTGMMDFFIYSSSPIEIEGHTKSISVWVFGNNKKYTLKLITKDKSGSYSGMTIGDLNFMGWKKLSADIPSYISQGDPHYHDDNIGIQIIGFKVECLGDTNDKYIIYLDDLRAVIDVADDPVLGW